MNSLDKQLNRLNKYYLFIHYKNKIKSVGYANNKTEVFKIFKNNYINMIKKEDYNTVTLILLKISKVKYDPNSKMQLISGPVKIDITFFYLSNRGAIKSNDNEKRNNHLFYTPKFLEKNKISKLHFKLIAMKAYLDKLEKRTLAPKTIEQIFKH